MNWIYLNQIKDISLRKKLAIFLDFRIENTRLLPAFPFVCFWHISWKSLFPFSFVSSFQSVRRPFSSSFLFKVSSPPCPSLSDPSPLSPLPVALTRSEHFNEHLQKKRKRGWRRRVRWKSDEQEGKSWNERWEERELKKMGGKDKTVDRHVILAS